MVAALAGPPAEGRSIIVNPAPGPAGVEYVAELRPEGSANPCVDWSFAGRHGATIWLRGLPPPPSEGCPDETQFVSLGQLPAGRYELLAQVALTGEVFAEVAFEVGGSPSFPSEITVTPARPTPDQPVRVTLSMINTICFQHHFPHPAEIDGDHIAIDGEIFYFPFLCPPNSWGEGFTFFLPPLTPGLKEIEIQAGGFGVARLAFTVAEPPQRLLLRDRYDVRLSWRDAGGLHEATAEPLTAESGQFWFFRPSNVEMTVKILDGTAVNGHIWVFAASMTDLEYTLTVTDRRGSYCDLPGPPPECPQQVYQGTAGANQNIIDTRAFAVEIPL